MKPWRFARYAVSLLLIVAGSADVTAQSAAFEAPQYQAIKKQLIRGWGTWDSGNILGQVFLPDGVGLNLVFKETTWIGAEYLNTALIGRSGTEAEQVRPGLHALDGSYSEFELRWRTLDVEITSGVVGNDLVMLIFSRRAGIWRRNRMQCSWMVGEVRGSSAKTILLSRAPGTIHGYRATDFIPGERSWDS
jgi:hypothetical protein